GAVGAVARERERFLEELDRGVDALLAGERARGDGEDADAGRGRRQARRVCPRHELLGCGTLAEPDEEGRPRPEERLSFRGRGVARDPGELLEEGEPLTPP